jgi:hypothetical protein
VRPDGTPDRIHVYPVGDLREHETEGPECWCKPAITHDDGGEIVAHNALDQREKYESGELRPS